MFQSYKLIRQIQDLKRFIIDSKLFGEAYKVVVKILLNFLTMRYTYLFVNNQQIKLQQIYTGKVPSYIIDV